MTAFTGTPQWMAPELMPIDASGRPRGATMVEYDERIDTFSVGVLLWSIATRSEPTAAYDLDVSLPLR
ncbi:MAG: hypothetical protein QGF33_13735, partial [Alphaproteobacteria bacterium]|nr:hypothetical protein [Alphaproteobacteria bacterium]